MNLGLGELKRVRAVRWVRITDVDGPGTEVSRRVRGGRYAREFDPRHKGLRYRGGATPDCISEPVGNSSSGCNCVQGGGLPRRVCRSWCSCLCLLDYSWVSGHDFLGSWFSSCDEQFHPPACAANTFLPVSDGPSRILLYSSLLSDFTRLILALAYLLTPVAALRENKVILTY